MYIRVFGQPSIDAEASITSWAAMGGQTSCNYVVYSVWTDKDKYEGRCYPKFMGKHVANYLHSHGISVNPKHCNAASIVLIMGTGIEYPYRFESPYKYRVVFPDVTAAFSHLFFHEYYHLLVLDQPRRYKRGERLAEKFAHDRVEHHLGYEIDVTDRAVEAISCDQWIRQYRSGDRIPLTENGQKQVEALTGKVALDLVYYKRDMKNLYVKLEPSDLKPMRIEKSAFKDIFVTS